MLDFTYEDQCFNLWTYMPTMLQYVPTSGCIPSLYIYIFVHIYICVFFFLQTSELCEPHSL